jgi:hypothetical protein
MSDFEMLSIVIMIIGLVVTILIHFIKDEHTKK